MLKVIIVICLCLACFAFGYFLNTRKDKPDNSIVNFGPENVPWLIVIDTKTYQGESCQLRLYPDPLQTGFMFRVVQQLEGKDGFKVRGQDVVVPLSGDPEVYKLEL